MKKLFPLYLFKRNLNTSVCDNETINNSLLT